MAKKGVAAIFGCLSIDICPRFVTEGAKDFADVIQPGGVTRILGNDVFSGGSVANTGIAMKIFGVDPIFCGKIGVDDFGAMLRTKIIEQAGEDVLAGIIEDPNADTAYSLILAPEGLDRAILQNPGGNAEYSEKEVDLGAPEFSECRLVHFGHPPNVRHFYQDCGFELVNLFRKARKRGMVTSLDLCALDHHSEAGKADWRLILANVLPLVDFFLPSIDELRDMLQMPDATPEELAATSISYGAKNVLIKCGEKGMYYENSDSFDDICEKLGFAAGAMKDWESQKGMAPAVYVENMVSGLGAGDTTIGAYLAAMMRGFSFQDTIDLARKEGALCVQDASSVGGLKPFEAIMD